VWGQYDVPIFFYAWHVLNAWRLCSMEKIKDSKVECAIFYYLHMVMFMSINPNETIYDFKARGKERVENFDNLHLPSNNLLLIVTKPSQRVVQDMHIHCCMMLNLPVLFSSR
jgi:hypothetical protein